MKSLFCLVMGLGLTGGTVVLLHGRSAPSPGERSHSEPAVTVAAPEIDPTTLTGPLMLLGAGTLILTDRWRSAARRV